MENHIKIDDLGVPISIYRWQVGGWTNPFEKYAQVKLDHFPKDRGENKK